ncbi:hypothetical protein BST61_g1132 [Cercospora zeina]
MQNQSRKLSSSRVPSNNEPPLHISTESILLHNPLRNMRPILKRHRKQNLWRFATCRQQYNSIPLQRQLATRPNKHVRRSGQVTSPME